MLAYIGDLLIAAPSVSLCAEHLRTVLRFLADHGWIVNNRCGLYMSPCPDLQAVAIDAFNHCWDSWDLLYLFPPYPLISKALA